MRRADAAASRGSPPGHASPGRGCAHGLGLGREPPVPTGGGESGGGREAGSDRGRAAGKEGTAEACGGGGRVARGAGRTPGDTARRGQDGETTADRRRDPTQPTPPTAGPPPPPRGARPSPNPRQPTPRANNHPETACGARKLSKVGDTDHGRPVASARAQIPFSSPHRQGPHYSPTPATEAGGGGGTPCLHLGGRRAQRPCEDTPSHATPGEACT